MRLGLLGMLEYLMLRTKEEVIICFLSGLQMQIRQLWRLIQVIWFEILASQNDVNGIVVMQKPTMPHEKKPSNTAAVKETDNSGH